MLGEMAALVKEQRDISHYGKRINQRILSGTASDKGVLTPALTFILTISDNYVHKKYSIVHVK